jgi:hypothetical protein
MAKGVVLAMLGLVLLCIGQLQSSPLRGHYREQRLKNEKRARLSAGTSYDFRDSFRANQRACVIVEGDHNPPTNLTIKVFDSAGNLVASDNKGDFLAAIWYPSRTQEYLVSITSDGSEFNDLDIVVK